jgi:integral membrane sensor domain MASE1
MKINVEKKKRVVFSLIMGLITTGIISFTLVVVNIGFTQLFLKNWFISWSIAYIVVTPVILLFAPFLQNKIDSYFDSKEEIS